MTMPFLFEFLNQKWVPAGLRRVERELLEFLDNLPLRNYNRFCADLCFEIAKENNLTTIVEAAAGTAPVTRIMAADSRSQGESIRGLRGKNQNGKKASDPKKSESSSK